MNKREYTKENYLKNGNKTQNNNPLNESGIEAKKKGF